MKKNRHVVSKKHFVTVSLTFDPRSTSRKRMRPCVMPRLVYDFERSRSANEEKSEARCFKKHFMTLTMTFVTKTPRSMSRNRSINEEIGL